MPSKRVTSSSEFLRKNFPGIVFLGNWVLPTLSPGRGFPENSARPDEKSVWNFFAAHPACAQMMRERGRVRFPFNSFCIRQDEAIYEYNCMIANSREGKYSMKKRRSQTFLNIYFYIPIRRRFSYFPRCYRLQSKTKKNPKYTRLREIRICVYCRAYRFFLRRWYAIRAMQVDTACGMRTTNKQIDDR